MTVRKTRLATPVQTEDGPITERVSSVTFRGTGRGLGRIAPGQFKEFPLSLKLPDRPGTLTFPAYQTYSDGEVVKWTGGPGSDLPAPALTLAAPPTATTAHAPVRGRRRAPGSTVRGVRTVKVRFGEAVVTGLITVSRGPTVLKPARSGLAPSNHAVLRARFARPLAAGRYTVSWRARSDDGHARRGAGASPCADGGGQAF